MADTTAIPGVENTLTGTDEGETISGAGKADTIDGNGGDDTLKGRNGHDDLDGGAGDDYLNGGNGGDTLHGGEGEDTLQGGNGNDRFVIDGDLVGLSFDTVLDFDVDRQLRKMTYNDQVELHNVGGLNVRFTQNGDDVELYIGDDLMAVFNGSQGELLAADVLAATRVVGDEPALLEVGSVPESLFNGVLIKGIDAFDQSGYSVSSAGDVDGDGLDDIIIGAALADAGGSASGENYLVFGSALSNAGEGTGEIDLATLTATQGVLIKGADANDRSGNSVSSAGDVDGDGLDDIIIGAYTADASAGDSGESYLVFGSALAAASDGTGEIDLATLTSSQGVLIKGIDSSDYSGYSVSSAGDVDGDGLDDVIIGARTADAGGNASGESYLVFGSALLAAGDSTGEINLATLSASQGVLIKGVNGSDSSGLSVSLAGDVDGDGLDDVIIGAPFADAGATDSGESYLVFGSALLAASDSTGEIDLGTLSASQGVLINGIDAEDRSGYSVSSAGDVDGDGLDDVIIGAYRGDTGATDSGESYLVFGSALAAASEGTGEINLATLTASQGVVINGIDASDYSGLSVSSAGDVDSDGLDDIIIGARLGDPDGATDAGESYVISGALLLEESTTGDGVIDLADLFVI